MGWGCSEAVFIPQSVCSPTPLTVPIPGTLGCRIPGARLLALSVVCPHLGTAAVSPQGVSASPLLLSGNRWENWNREIGRGL